MWVVSRLLLIYAKLHFFFFDSVYRARYLLRIKGNLSKSCYLLIVKIIADLRRVDSRETFFIRKFESNSPYIYVRERESFEKVRKNQFIRAVL